MARKQRTDTTKGAVVSMASALAKPIQPPKHVHLRKKDKLFWNSIVNTRARERWTAPDLELAAALARAKSDIERLQKEIDAEGDVIPNERGTLVANPKHALLETISRRVIALTKSLQVHAEATQGKSRDQVKANKAQSEAKGVLDSIDSKSLIARPH